MVFEPFWSENGYKFEPIPEWFSREPRERVNIFVFSSPKYFREHGETEVSENISFELNFRVNFANS